MVRWHHQLNEHEFEQTLVWRARCMGYPVSQWNQTKHRGKRKLDIIPRFYFYFLGVVNGLCLWHSQPTDRIALKAPALLKAAPGLKSWVKFHLITDLWPASRITTVGKPTRKPFEGNKKCHQILWHWVWNKLANCEKSRNIVHLWPVPKKTNEVVSPFMVVFSPREPSWSNFASLEKNILAAGKNNVNVSSIGCK